MVRDTRKRILDAATIIGAFGVIILALSIIPGLVDDRPEMGTYIAVAAGAVLIPCSIFISACLIMKKIDEKVDELKK